MANLKQFVKSTLENRGASFNLVTGKLNPTSGYMVAIKGHTRTFDNVTGSKQLQYLIADYIKDKAIILASGIADNDIYLGSWFDGDTLYLDVSTNIKDKEEAQLVGILAGEKAIWDCAAGKEIRL